MESFKSYQNVEEVSESSKSIIYRAISTKNNNSVIIKLFKKNYPTYDEIMNFYHEFDIISTLSEKGIIKFYEKDEINSKPVIIMEDFGGVSLDHFLKNKLHVYDFLKLAIDIAEALGDIHKNNIIHKDINPSNIVWNKEKKILKIIDFHISTELSKEITTVKNPNIIEGTLAYISPEQTGRMNRSLDYRTDFYSLGVTFFQMLTGQLPFEKRDMLELIYSHIVVQPPAPNEVDNTIPEVISDIIIKLLSKNKEDRYQSVHGLIHDLEYCLNELKINGKIKPFEIAQSDVSNNFHISQKLYGREKDIEMLISSFERVRKNHTELMLISGYSGIGKTRLINEIQKPIVKHGGYFISGNFEKLKKSVPYSGTIQAFTDLGRQILAEDEFVIKVWKEKIFSALKPNAKIITKLIPFFEYIIGEQSDVSDYGAVESQNRFNFVFKNFVNIFSSYEHPLVIFFDNLQWADSASLDILKLITTDPDIKHLLVIGSYRHDETPESHPFILTLNEIEKLNTVINYINLKPLNEEDVSQLLSDTLNKPAPDTKSLADLVVKKTEGNPFFINIFLRHLYNEGLIEFFFEKGWMWNIETIEEIEATDNVINLMSKKIKNLPIESQEILKFCSCTGSYFKISLLSMLIGKPEADIKKALSIPLDEGMIYKIDDFYRFSHDRIFESVYSLLPEKEKLQIHYAIGRLELKLSDDEEFQNKLFYITNQLNSGSSLVTDAAEKQKLAQLNLIAGKKALVSSAYKSAIDYFNNGIDLLDKNSWKKNYAFTHELYQEAVIAAQLSADYDRMGKLAEILLLKTQNVHDRIKVNQAKIFAYSAQNKFDMSIKTSIAALEELGFKIPENPGIFRVIFELLCIKLYLLGKSIEDLINLPENKDKRILAAQEIISAASSSYIGSNPNLVGIMTFSATRSFLNHGVSSITPFICECFGSINCSILDNIDDGYRWGELGLALCNKYDMRKYKSKIFQTFYTFIQHWKESIRTSFDPLLDGYKFGLENGDLEFAAYCVCCYTGNIFLAGIQLEEVEMKILIYLKIIKKLNQETVLIYQRMQHQTVLNLLNKTQEPAKLSGTAYEIDKMLPIHEDEKNQLAIFCAHAYSLILSYIFENYEKALAHAEITKELVDSQLGFTIVPVVYLYDSLTRLAVYSSVKISIQKKLMKQVKKNQAQMKKWARSGPMNYSHKYHLVEAEINCIKGKGQKAANHYDIAINLAHKNNFLNEEALSLELAAKFWMEQGNNSISKYYMTKAYYTYKMWGAAAKINQLLEKYSQQIELNQSVSTENNWTSSTTNSTSTSTSELIDLKTVIKASHTIASEIDLKKLLISIMKFCMENAGAEKGFLIIKNEKDNNFYIESEVITGEKIRVDESIPISGHPRLCVSIINYVIKTGEFIVLNDAEQEGIFKDDSYIVENKIKSLLCFPIKYKSEMSSILYMENNLSTSAFSHSRSEILRILSVQAAISIENTRLIKHRENSAKLEKEMEIAVDIQAGLLPESPKITDYEILAYMEPADDVGGDYYDFINTNSKDWMVIGDVAGHGVPAGLIMMMVQTAIHTVLAQQPEISPSELLNIINKVIIENTTRLKEEKYMTITVFTVNDNGKFIFSGLHKDIMVFRSEKNEVELIKSKGAWIGLMNNIKNKLSDESFEMHKNDTLLVYTDGITEAWEKGSIKNQRDPLKQMFGVEKLNEVFQKNGSGDLDKIKDNILHELKNYEKNDDVTMVLIRRLI